MTAQFLNKPLFRVHRDGEWVLATPLEYVTSAGENIAIPAGFITDLASIPRVFHSLIPVNGKHRLAAVVHDYLYVIQDRQRIKADALFLEAMEVAGVRFTQRWTMYLAVRAGGWLPWARREKAKETDRATYLKENGL